MKFCKDCEHRPQCRVPTEGLEGPCRGRRILASNVRHLRCEADLTQRELANRAGIDRSYLSQLEGEAINISIDVLFAIAKALKVEPGRLLRHSEHA